MNRILHYHITEREAGKTVDTFLKHHGFSRHIITHLKKTKNGITVNEDWAYVRTVLSAGDDLCIFIEELHASENIVPTRMPLSIIFEDEDILVLNKPADTPIHPSINNYDNTLANGVAWYYHENKSPFVFRCINRLDRDTTGLILVAKNMLSAALLSSAMLERKISRTYLAIVSGIAPEYGTVDAPIGRKENSAICRCIDDIHGERAVTHFKRLSLCNGCSLVELKLETGRTHQIRVHMKHLGFPLIGDYLYHPDYTFISRQALHSWRLTFAHPISGLPLSFTAPLPADMQSVIRP